MIFGYAVVQFRSNFEDHLYANADALRDAFNGSVHCCLDSTLANLHKSCMRRPLFAPLSSGSCGNILKCLHNRDSSDLMPKITRRFLREMPEATALLRKQARNDVNDGPLRGEMGREEKKIN